MSAFITERHEAWAGVMTSHLIDRATFLHCAGRERRVVMAGLNTIARKRVRTAGWFREDFHRLTFPSKLLANGFI